MNAAMKAAMLRIAKKSAMSATLPVPAVNANVNAVDRGVNNS